MTEHGGSATTSESSGRPLVRTVIGDVEAAAVGRLDYHEHLFQVSPLLPGEELDDEAASREEAAILRSSGIDAMIDATPIGLGRNPEATARIAAATGLAVISSTGMHRSAHYPDGHPLRSLDADDKAALFVRELTIGQLRDEDDAATFAGGLVPDAPTALSPSGDAVRAAVVKTGIDYWRIDAVDRSTLEAAAEAHLLTGAPVMVHLEFCSAAHEVLDLLEGGGVAADRVVLAHADRDPDPGLHVDLAARGAYLGYDGMGRSKTRSDAELLDLTRGVVEAGAAERILLGNDVARRSRYRAYGGLPGLGYFGERYLPRLRAAVGDEVVDGILRGNPARFLPWRH